MEEKSHDSTEKSEGEVGEVSVHPDQHKRHGVQYQVQPKYPQTIFPQQVTVCQRQSYLRQLTRNRRLTKGDKNIEIVRNWRQTIKYSMQVSRYSYACCVCQKQNINFHGHCCTEQIP